MVEYASGRFGLLKMKRTIDRSRPWPRRFGRFVVILIGLYVSACGSTATTPMSRRQAEPAPGFVERMMNEVTERGCNVGKFICPYGWGPAGEPCECTDPSGIVVKGRTVR
jgi:hypothetical protein